jgi:Zn-dependent peptidase ImmA (M78 family)
MRTLEAMSANCAIMFMLGLSVFLVKGISCAEEGKYPIKVEIIDKAQARYDTPENAYVAMISSLIKKDLEWYYETFTKESAAQNKKEYQEAGIDPRKKFDTVTDLKDIFIVGKMKYKSGIILIVKSYEQNGTIMQVPSPFVKEGSKWKLTNAFSADEELHQYLDYIKPEEIISSAIKIHPGRWSLNWSNWIKEHMEEKEWIEHFAEKVTILCIITDLKDNQGKPYSVKEIVPETILLNYLLHPQPWRFNSEEKVALIIKSKENRYLKKRKGFKEWQNRSRLLKKYKSPVMLVKFNKFKAMETLPEMIPGKEYEVTLSGELKNGKQFKGTTKIIITGWNAKHRWKWNHPDWLNSEKDIDNWWNKENDFEDWWKKTIKKR